ncbi:MAG: hypothetical protein QXS48_01410 [Candidatus Aenigmatarchaeota archaeon]
MSKKLCLLFLFLIFFSSLAVSVKAQEYGDFWSVEYFWTKVFGLPEEWMPTQNIRNFIFNFMVPFLALYAIILGILRQLRIFWRTPAIEIVVAFAFAFSTLPSKAFITYVYITMALGTVAAYTIFLILFIGGWALYSLAYLRKWGSRADLYKYYRKSMGRLSKEEKILTMEIARLYEELSNIKPGDPRAADKMNKINKKIQTLKDRLDTVREQMRSLKTSHEL